MPVDVNAILERYKRKARARRRIKEVIGVLILLSGYALLAVSPDTPSDWLLFRVIGGFVALLLGFGLAILPIVARAVGGDE